MLQGGGCALDLAVFGFTPELPDKFGALGKAGGAKRVALGEKPPRRVGDMLAAVGVVAVPDIFFGGTFRRQADGLISQELVGCKAIMQLDNLYIILAATTVVAQFLATFEEFPPRQKAASFTIDQVVEKYVN